MKKNTARLLATSIISLLLLSPVPARAQIVISQHIWSRGTTVTIFNDTQDHKPVKVSIDDKSTKRILHHGERLGIHSGNGPFVLYSSYYHELTISAQVCDNAPKTQFVNPPPDWAADQSFLGSLALTAAYLGSNPSEPELKQRVREIEKFLEKRLGRKEMKGDLKEWFESVKRSGLGFSGENCGGSVVVGTRVNIQNDPYNNAQRSIALYIRGNSASGYRIDTPGYAY